MGKFLCLAAGISVFFAFGSAQELPHGTPASVSPLRPLYLYSHFRDSDTSHLRLSYSHNATEWLEVNPQGSFGSGAMRDPSVMYVAATKTFYFIATPLAGQTGIQFFSSVDLVNFTKIRDIEITTYIPGTVTAWAPEWWHDPQDGKYYFFVSISTDPQSGGSSTAKMYPYLIPFDPVSGQVIAPARSVVLSGTTQERTFDHFPYYDGKQYFLLYVDQQPGGEGGYVTQPIAYATSARLEGPYTQQTLPGTDYFGLGTFQSEAPTLIRIGQSECVRLIFDTWVGAPADPSNSVATAGRKYTPVYRDSCTNLGTLFSQTSLVHVPNPLDIIASEHGTIIALADPVTASIVADATAATARATATGK